MENLLVPVDLSEVSGAVVDRACCIAKSFSSKVWLLHIQFRPGPWASPHVDQRQLRLETANTLRVNHHELEHLADMVRERGIPVVRYHIIHSHITQAILTEAKKVKANLIVMGTHGHSNLYRTLFGGNGQRVARLAECPVMLVSNSEIKPCSYWMRKLFGDEPAIRIGAREFRNDDYGT